MTRACPRPERHQVAIGKQTEPEHLPTSALGAGSEAGSAEDSGSSEHDDDTAAGASGSAEPPPCWSLELWDNEGGAPPRPVAR